MVSTHDLQPGALMQLIALKSHYFVLKSRTILNLK
jgi:hypothetical protein